MVKLSTWKIERCKQIMIRILNCSVQAATADQQGETNHLEILKSGRIGLGIRPEMYVNVMASKFRIEWMSENRYLLLIRELGDYVWIHTTDLILISISIFFCKYFRVISFITFVQKFNINLNLLPGCQMYCLINFFVHVC